MKRTREELKSTHGIDTVTAKWLGGADALAALAGEGIASTAQQSIIIAAPHNSHVIENVVHVTLLERCQKKVNGRGLQELTGSALSQHCSLPTVH